MEKCDGAEEASRVGRGVCASIPLIGIVEEASPLKGPSVGLGLDLRVLVFIRGLCRCRGLNDCIDPAKPDGGEKEDPMDRGNAPESSSTGDMCEGLFRHQQLKKSTRFIRLRSVPVHIDRDKAHRL